MHVAIIGSSGQLGSDLLKVLGDTGRYRLTSISHLDLDITNKNQVTAVIGQGHFDIVVNCAAFTRVDDCEDAPAEALRVNAQGAFEVARACAVTDALCVHISTDYVFSGEKGSPYLEDDPVGPVSVYGVSKVAGEFLVREAAKRWLIVRISSVFGKAGSSGKGGNFIETILAKACSEAEVKVVDDIWMSPTYTVDAAKAIEGLIRSEAGGIVHAPNTGRCTWFEFASTIFELAGLNPTLSPINAVSYPTRARRPRDSSLSNDQITKRLGRPIPSWREALKAYLVETSRLPA